MTAATMTSKGQITVPKDVRDALGLVTGSRVDFTRTKDGVYELRVEHRPVMNSAGSLRYVGPAKSIEEMDEAIARAAAESLR